ncbi:hypothetical protein [Aquiflexum lacus]|uniref:hypothetical protein n=1 Tax=Aquiflexum lacus TaxID=2483805 RepID=UPI001895FB8D|nr:hypothetical protein [Aquiflexum lacus]
MRNDIPVTGLLIFCLIMLSCNKPTNELTESDVKSESVLIKKTVNDETKAAFQREYEQWSEFWVHENYVTKTYINFGDSSMSENIGWSEIDSFIKEFFVLNPDPDSVPVVINDMDIRFFGNGALVNFEQHDPERGLKRESRLMEKIDGKWKIAGMHTTIYGLKH